MVICCELHSNHGEVNKLRFSSFAEKESGYFLLKTVCWFNEKVANCDSGTIFVCKKNNDIGKKMKNIGIPV